MEMCPCSTPPNSPFPTGDSENWQNCQNLPGRNLAICINGLQIDILFDLSARLSFILNDEAIRKDFIAKVFIARLLQS